MAASQICIKCGRSLREGEFYTYKDGKKMKMCKKCLTMHLDNFDPETFLWILKDLDIPYIPGEWNVLRDRAYAKDPYNMNGMSVIGKYISKMKLKQWREYSWADTERIEQENKEKEEEARRNIEKLQAEAKEQFEAGEITEAEYKTLVSVPEQQKNLQQMAPPTPLPQQQPRNPLGDNNPFQTENFLPEEDLIDSELEMTKDEKIAMALKWGRLYQPSEWLALEKDYDQMMKSFDIQDADTKNTLTMLCKTNLKANQALDQGDYDGFQKLARVQSDLRKTAKFTAAQNKEQKSDFVDCVGELVAYCEKVGGEIPKHEIKVAYDIVDTIIEDLKEYNKSLVYRDPSLAQQIETYLKNREIADEKLRLKKLAKLEGKSVEEFEAENATTDIDIAEHYERILTEAASDQLLQEGDSE